MQGFQKLLEVQEDQDARKRQIMALVEQIDEDLKKHCQQKKMAKVRKSIYGKSSRQTELINKILKRRLMNKSDNSNK